MMTYICKGAIVKTRWGQEGKVIGTDHKNKIAIVQIKTAICSKRFESLEVVSYKGVF